MSQSTEISKQAVYDDRCFTQTPKYAVNLSGTSINNSPFQAISANASQMSFQIQIPSETVYVSRDVQLTSDCYLAVNVTVAGTFAAGDPVLRFGQDCALSVYPIHCLTNTISATINNSTVTTNNADTMFEVLRMTDMGKNRRSRTTPTYLDTYASYNSAYGALNNPLGSYANSVSNEDMPNGAYYNVQFTMPDGSALPVSASPAYTSNGIAVNTDANGIPIGTVQAGPVLAPTYPLFIKFTSTEQILLSPFIFSGDEDSTGLFGIQNIQLLYTFSNPAITGLNGRVLRSTNVGGRTINSVNYNTGVTNIWGRSTVNVVTISPPLSLPLPPSSCVPYLEFPRFVSRVSGLSAGAYQSYGIASSNTITLPCIP